MPILDFPPALKFSKQTPFPLRNTCAMTFHSNQNHQNQNLRCMAAEPGTVLCFTVTRQKRFKGKYVLLRVPENQQVILYNFLLFPRHTL